MLDKTTAVFPTPRIALNEDNFSAQTQRLPIATREMLRLAIGLKRGSLTVTMPEGVTFFINAGAPGPHGEIILRDHLAARRIMVRGDVGLGEAYTAGLWDSPDVTSVVALFAANPNLTTDFLARSPLARFMLQLKHFFNRNTKSGSRRNISSHYDLGNGFYGTWLDRSMTYSSAIFVPGDNDLAVAQERKYRQLAQAIGVQRGEEVLEIGCGWGGFAEYLGRECGAKVTALTISREQFDYASERIQKAGLNDRVSIKLQDYRDEQGRYDRIGSIEMFEAVGESYWPSFFRTLSDRLKEGGTAGLQIITIPEHFFEDYRRNIDFIRRHVFPGGMLPSPERLGRLAQDAGLKFENELIFGQDYAETLRQWRESFERAWPRLLPMGFDERFRRLWRYYLCYCEAGFDAGSIDVRQLLYRKA
jgi:cyclopropane-fatty-acyl-phospholipid synthase